MRRRDLLRLAGVAPAVWFTACQPSPVVEAERGTGPRDLLVLRTGSGLAVVDANLGRVVAGPRAGVSSANGSAFATASAGAPTTVDVTRSTGRSLYRSTVDGTWAPRVVAPDGDLVALASAEPGRTRTTIVVADEHGQRYRFDLPGNLEPEAFSTTHDYLYLLDYLPPQAPDRYRVRALNLGTGAVIPLLTRDKQAIPPGAEEEMRGEGRQAVYVARRQFLFTLYTHQPEHDHTRDLIAARSSGAHAFVHSLSLEQAFAYCVDLPAPFGEGPAEGHVIAVAPDSDDPVVIDTTSGTVAELDGLGLTVRQTVRIVASTEDGPAAAVLNGLLFLGRGRLVTAWRPEGYGLVRSWPMPAPVRGLGLSVDRKRLWVGQPDGLVALDVVTGRLVAEIAVPDLVGIDTVGAKS